jgi:exodeoxyribonuclease V gamma subunit
VEPKPFLAAPLPAVDREVVQLEDLVNFARHPVRAFLRQRLGISVGSYADEIADSLPVELDKLQEWQVGQRMLEARLAGATQEAAVAAERARGDLPPGRLSDSVIEQIQPDVEAVYAEARGLLPGEASPGSVDVRVELPDGRRLSGTVPGVCGTLLRSVTYSRVNPRHRLTAWVRFLALTAAHPGRSFEAATVGRAAYGSGQEAVTTVVRLPRLTPQVALEHLVSLVALHDAGLREPLPIACLTSAAYARALKAGGDPVKAATSEWESGWRFPKEDQELEHQLVLGRVLRCEELLRDTRFDQYALRLWDPVLDWEEVEHR